MKRISKHIILILTLLVFQIAIISNLPSYLSHLNLILVCLMFLSVVYKFKLGIVYAFIFGVLLDIYSALPFGAYLIALTVTIYLAYKFFNQFLTNKSVYSLIGLTALSTVVFNLIMYSYKVLFYYSNAREFFSFDLLLQWIKTDFVYQLVINLIFVIVLFLVYNFTSNRFRAVFIDTTKQ